MKTAEQLASQPQCQQAQPCPRCGSAAKPDAVDVAFWAAEGVVILEGIPLRTCADCGDASHDEETARRIKQIIAGASLEAHREIVVPVFALTSVGERAVGTQPAHPGEGQSEVVELTFGARPRATPGEDRGPIDPHVCPFCRCGTAASIVRSLLCGHRGWIAVEEIPARVCPCCDEQFYDDATSWRLVALTEDSSLSPEPLRRLKARVVSF